MNQHIIIIDDDQQYSQELAEFLSENGYRCRTYNNGTSAVKDIRLQIPDLILLDLRLPEKNGFQIANDLAQDPLTKGIPVIAVTGYFTQDEHKQLMNVLGIKFCQTKPIRPDVLLKIINLSIKHETIKPNLPAVTDEDVDSLPELSETQTSSPTWADKMNTSQRFNNRN
ncbi:MAG: two-component system response regulator [Candidatus Omnitrophota bacterium]